MGVVVYEGTFCLEKLSRLYSVVTIKYNRILMILIQLAKTKKL